MLKESNPIQQRIEGLADKWKSAIEVKTGRVIRIHAKEEETQMVDAFIWYMLGLDSQIDDVAFILDPFFSDEDSYSQCLLAALDECIREWNELEKPESIDFVAIDWKPDYNRTIEDKKNPAALFVRNFNGLAEALNMEDGRFLVATLTLPHDYKKRKEVCQWVASAIEAGISHRVRFLITDTEENPIFNKLADDYSRQIVTIIPEMDMDNVMSQVAAMGDPADPSTPYRISFMGMMNAIKNNDKKKAVKEGENCIRIAEENKEKNPHWIIQIVVVHIALCNNQIQHKDYKEALKEAGKAIETAQLLPDLLGLDVGSPMLAQAYMTKAAVYCYPKEWKKAIQEYVSAAGSYTEAKNIIMAIEAYRMAGFCASKAWESENAVEYLVKGFRLGTQANKQSVQKSTYAVLIKQLLNKNYKDKIRYDEIDHIASLIYGEDWQEKIDKAWKEAPDAKEQYGDRKSVTEAQA